MADLHSWTAHRRIGWQTLLTLAVAISIAGCGQRGGLSVYPVSGTVRHAGTPAAGAKVVFYAVERPDASVPFPSGIVQSDGTFRLSSYGDGDGAPAGSYNVAIEWPEPIPPGAHRESFTPADRLRGKYANPDRSNLKATVTAGDNALPAFDLK